ncbi:MAG: MFS transporter [Hespellia sp.]|nr:MFS transporter [Hespellia sp.]
MNQSTSAFSKAEKKIYTSCCYIFLTNGALALLVGTLLPYIRDSYGLNYQIAGFLVSAHAIGNLISSFLGGVLPLRIGRKRTAVLLCSCGIIAFLIIVATGNSVLLILAFFLTGINRGAVSNFNNAVVNDIATGKAWAFNLLHAIFCIGAFLAPFLVVLLTKNNPDNWYIAALIEAFFVLTEVILLLKMDVPNNFPQKEAAGSTDWGFLKNRQFIAASGILFSYLCAEQAVNGWLVTYLKDSGIMSASFSQIMTGVLWLVILGGRLLSAVLSTKVKKSILLLFSCIGYLIFFILLITSRSAAPVAVGIIGIGFFMAGLYPTTVACAGDVIKAYPLSLSILLTITSLGAILMPSIIGIVAKRVGIVGGMSTIIVAVIVTFGFIVYNVIINREQTDANHH